MISVTLRPCSTWKTVPSHASPDTSNACTVLFDGKNSSISIKSKSHIRWASFSDTVGRPDAARNNWGFSPAFLSTLVTLSAPRWVSSLAHFPVSAASLSLSSTEIPALSSIWLLGSTPTPNSWIPIQ